MRIALFVALTSCVEKGAPLPGGDGSLDTSAATPDDSTSPVDSGDTTGGGDSTGGDTDETGDTGSPPVDLPDCAWEGGEDGPQPCADCRFIAIEATADGVCGVTLDGDIACWGHYSDRPTDGPYVAIFGGGGNSTCALRSDGRACCWPSNLSASADLAAPGDVAFTNLAPGGYHGCGVDTDGEVHCWGGDDYDQASPPAGSFLALSAGSLHTCGIRSDHTLACWGVNAENDAWEEGMNDHGQVDDVPSGTVDVLAAGSMGNCAIDSSGALSCWGYVYDADEALFEQVATDVSFGTQGNLCIVAESGEVFCNLSWPTSDEVSDEDNIPPTDGPYKQVTVGANFGCALREDGQPDCWGSAYWGGLTPP